MTAEEIIALHVQMRYDGEAKSIVSDISPETRKYYAKLNKQIKRDLKKHKRKNEQ